MSGKPYSPAVLAGRKFWWPVDTTEWFPKNVTPVYEGIYRTRIDFLNGEKTEYGYSYWKDGFWGAQVANRELAAQAAYNPLGCNVGLKEWKGLAFDPCVDHIQPDTLHGQVLRDIAAEMEISPQALTKIALAYYQKIHLRRKMGQDMAFTDTNGQIVKEMSMLAPA